MTVGIVLVAIGFALGWVFTGIMYSHAVQATQARWEEAEKREQELDQAFARLDKMRDRFRRRGWTSDALDALQYTKDGVRAMAPHVEKVNRSIARGEADRIRMEQDRREADFEEANQGGG